MYIIYKLNVTDVSDVPDVTDVSDVTDVTHNDIMYIMYIMLATLIQCKLDVNAFTLTWILHYIEAADSPLAEIKWQNDGQEQIMSVSTL